MPGVPCSSGPLPEVAPLSETWTKLTLATCSQMAAASWKTPSQVDVDHFALKVWKRLLA